MSTSPGAGGSGDVDTGLDDLMGRLADQMTTLVAEEIRLAQTEARATLRQAAEGGALLAAGGVAGGVGVLLMALAACRALGKVVPEPVAYGVVGGAFLAASGALGLAGRTQLADLELLEHTRDSLEETGRVLAARLRAGLASRT
jgi:hypothetical protein